MKWIDSVKANCRAHEDHRVENFKICFFLHKDAALLIE
jgi:hypothetical protein